MTHFVIDMQTALEHSFRNFHAKGLDYLCLRRTPELTEKLYFLDGAACDGDAVVPHDHRYDFTQTVLRGRCTNLLFEERAGGDVWHRFRYETPLNGGSGFASDGLARVAVKSAVDYHASEFWFERSEEIHTIRCKPGTILHQRQYQDRVETATRAYSKASSIPSLDGLYDHMTDAHVFECVRLLVAAGHNVEIVAP